ncbi:MAG: hypothetical protein ACKV2V_00830 [Blastocatellia bacterium]
MQFAVIFFLIAHLFSSVACARNAQTSEPGAAAHDPAVVLADSPAQTAPQTPAPANIQSASDNTKFALIISGISGEDVYAAQFDKWTADLRAALVEKHNFAADQVMTLTEKPDGQALKASAEEVKKAFADLRARVKPDSKLFLFFIGHGSFDGKISKFNLSGPDLSAEEYAAQLKTLTVRNVVIINTASASGDFIKPLSAQGRIVITATRSGMEQNATKFADYFIAALSGKAPAPAAAPKKGPSRTMVQLTKPDPAPALAPTGNLEADTDKNSRISVLEAFEYTTKLVADFYKTENRLATEHALLDDNGDGKGHEKPVEGDGGLAKLTFFDSMPLIQAGGNPELAGLVAEKLRLEGEIGQLKGRKAQMKEEEYDAELERLLVDLAQVSQKIRAKQQK